MAAKGICLVSLFLLIGQSCKAKDNGKTKSEGIYAPIDSLMRAELSEGVADTLLSANDIILERVQIREGNDSILSHRKLNHGEIAVLRFLLATSNIKAQTGISFHKFSPEVRFIFTKKKVQYVVSIAFGSKEMQVIASNAKAPKMYALNDKNLLKFCNMLFPKDDFLKFLLKQE